MKDEYNLTLYLRQCLFRIGSRLGPLISDATYVISQSLPPLSSFAQLERIAVQIKDPVKALLPTQSVATFIPSADWGQ